MSNAYFWVDDADALYEEMKAKGAKRWTTAPAHNHTAFANSAFQDLDDQDISFGQVLR